MIKVSLNSKRNRINLGRKAGLRASNTIPNNRNIGKISKIWLREKTHKSTGTDTGKNGIKTKSIKLKTENIKKKIKKLFDLNYFKLIILIYKF